ncbi:FAD-dependent oxidoreductase [Streptomyces thermolineatus]
MTDLPDEGSYWTRTATAPRRPALAEDTCADVVVVGGGIAGICTARELALAGRDVVLVEAAGLAGGVTGHTTAKVSALHTLLYSRIERTRGPRAAGLYARSQQEAVEHVARTCERLGIDCDLERAPSFTWAESARTLGKLRAEAEAARRAGLPASLVDTTGLPFPVAGAVRVEGQLQFHPRKYLLALADDLVAHGGRIFEDTRVTGVDGGSPCLVRTGDGPRITAGHVVVATHYPVLDRALLFPRLEPHRELVLAAEIPEEEDPKGMYITPEGGTRSVRTTPLRDGWRLLIVTGEGFLPGAGGVEERHRRLAAWTRERFPSARPLCRWAAQDNSTTDRLPFVGPVHPGVRNVYVATGFGGWGMSNGVMASRLLAELLTGGSAPWAGLYDPRRLRPLREAPAAARIQATVARHFVGDRLGAESGRRAGEPVRGEGAVVRQGGRHCAVYRDDDGELHIVAARCTHMGCLVRFNDAERTWECPCHGSRFGVDGSVLQGPATRPLEKHSVPEAGETHSEKRT